MSFCGNRQRGGNVQDCQTITDVSNFSSLARWNEPMNIQPKQTYFRTSHHCRAVNCAELLTSIFIRLLNPYLRHPTGLECFIKALALAWSSQQSSGMTEFKLIHESSPRGKILDSSVVLTLLGTCLSEFAVMLRNLCGDTGMQYSDSKPVVHLNV